MTRKSVSPHTCARAHVRVNQSFASSSVIRHRLAGRHGVGPRRDARSPAPSLALSVCQVAGALPDNPTGQMSVRSVRSVRSRLEGGASPPRRPCHLAACRSPARLPAAARSRQPDSLSPAPRLSSPAWPHRPSLARWPSAASGPLVAVLRLPARLGGLPKGEAPPGSLGTVLRRKVPGCRCNPIFEGGSSKKSAASPSLSKSFLRSARAC